MPDYTIVLSKKVQKKLDSFSNYIAEPILLSIADLSKNPRPKGYIKLKGRDAYRIRSGNYRIIYEIYDDILLIDIIALGHRKDIYK
ncbi:MAG: type II toxin-antitoxin system RelE/ParE family toxin [Bacteroidales bacterium]|jgi:mRNA interferase RelE/StbE|nr:type II toxin-antitoxin system RelE/ParE family toxin [Bacteroidales bacterium]